MSDPNKYYQQRLQEMLDRSLDDAEEAHESGDREREAVDLIMAGIGYDLLRDLENDPLEKEN